MDLEALLETKISPDAARRLAEAVQPELDGAAHAKLAEVMVENPSRFYAAKSLLQRQRISSITSGMHSIEERLTAAQRGLERAWTPPDTKQYATLGERVQLSIAKTADELFGALGWKPLLNVEARIMPEIRERYKAAVVQELETSLADAGRAYEGLEELRIEMESNLLDYQREVHDKHLILDLAEERLTMLPEERAAARTLPPAEAHERMIGIRKEQRWYERTLAEAATIIGAHERLIGHEQQRLEMVDPLATELKEFEIELTGLHRGIKLYAEGALSQLDPGLFAGFIGVTERAREILGTLDQAYERSIDVLSESTRTRNDPFSQGAQRSGYRSRLGERVARARDFAERLEREELSYLR